MQIASAGSYGSSIFSPTANSSPTGSASGAASSAADGSSQDSSVVQDFLNYAKETPADRLRDSILKSMGLTEQQLDKMSPAQRQAIEKKIEQIIKQKLQQNAGQTGQLVNVSA
jgi:hypothetical protein